MFAGIDLLRYAVVFVAVLAVLGAGSFALRWVRIGRFGGRAAASRRRQPRLGVTELAAVGDGRRRLLLIRRDNVEHLIMTGGPTDVVVESNIVRASAAGPVRESPPARGTPDAPLRAGPFAEAGGMWPPEPEPSARATRGPATAAWEEAEPDTMPLPAQAPPREGTRKGGREAIRDRETALRVHGADRISRPAGDLRGIAESAPVAPPRRPAETRRAPPQPIPPITTSADQNLAEMAQRLESALQRPRSVAEPLVAPPASPPPVVPLPRTIDTVEPTVVRPEPEPRSDLKSDLKSELESEPKSETASETKPETNPGPKPAAKAASARAFDSLEQEMASLLGRPSGKS